MNRVVPTAEFASIVFGDDVALDDPAESFHEASRLYPHVAPGRVRTMAAIAANPELQQTAVRASRTHDHRPGLDLPPPRLPRARLRDVLARRKSEPPAVRLALRLSDLATILGTAYGVRVCDDRPRRPVPSGGALYPLELYVLPLEVGGLGRSAFHYHPFRHRLEPLKPFAEVDLAAALVDPSLADRAALVLVVTTVVWRTRFKYGLRGYRFALLEAGHLVQNVLLVAAALGLAAVPLGGWYDRRVDELVGADGLDEASVYLVSIGGRR
jgi:SagB-type dehydrogenase family enzyme